MSADPTTNDHGPVDSDRRASGSEEAVAADPRSDKPLIAVTKIHNLRDVGGLDLGDGSRLRSGVLFRSAQLGERNDHTLEQLEQLELDVVFDLRSTQESDVLPDFVPSGVEHAQLDVLADSTERIAAQLEDLFTDPLGATELLAGGVVQDHYVSTYRNLVTLDSARTSYAELFGAVADGRRALFHCTAGKDRTGWAAASLQALLGVPSRAVMEHYLESNTETLELFGGILNAFANAGGDPSALKPVFMVEQAYLDAAFDEVERSFGGIEQYFSDGLGLGRDSIGALRDRLILR